MEKTTESNADGLKILLHQTGSVPKDKDIYILKYFSRLKINQLHLKLTFVKPNHNNHLLTLVSMR